MKQNYGREALFFVAKIFLGIVVIPFNKTVITFTGPYRSFFVKENHFGSAVGKIFFNKQKDILLLLYKDIIELLSQ